MPSSVRLSTTRITYSLRTRLSTDHVIVRCLTRGDSPPRLSAELRQWRASLPPLLGAVKPSNLIHTFRRQATALKLSQWHAIIIGYRHFLWNRIIRNNDEMRNLAKESSTECTVAARIALEAVDRMAHDGLLVHAFLWTQ